MKSLPAALLALVLAVPAPAAGVSVKSFTRQRVGDTTYFHVTFDPPEGYNASAPVAAWWTSPDVLKKLPRLVPQDDKARAVYLRCRVPLRALDANLTVVDTPFTPLHQPLEFYGIWTERESPRFVLATPDADIPVTLDPSVARAIEIPPEAAGRSATKTPAENDLEAQWAVAQATRFAVLHSLSAGRNGFYSFACLATGRKYKVPVPDVSHAMTRDRDLIDDRLFDLTSASTAVTESLQIGRMLTADRDAGERTIDVTRVAGIDVPEHPWEKLTAGKKPADEPLARLVPHDQYYLTFRTFRAMTDLGDQFELWGAAAGHATGDARDPAIKQRYEKQICLKTTTLGRLLGPAVIRSVAVTGGDPYWNEGTDVTVILQAANKALLIASLQPFIEEARKEFGDRLREGKDEHNGVTVEKYVSPLREVSLYRAVIDDFVIHSNSPVALRRVIDTAKGRGKSVADSPDFRYMRTVFRADDESESGFAFLSDAFIRQLVGPASKIKEKRRLEALTALKTLGHGAMFAAWERGSLPADTAALLRAAPVKPDDLAVPDGQLPAWDAAAQTAVSDVYGTPRFLTPLVELPIDKVTPREEQAYRRFRDTYLGLWREYFDPIGVRFALDGKRLTTDVYVLPLIRSTDYRQLRQLAGGGTTKLDPSAIPADTVVQFLGHLSPEAQERRTLETLSRQMLPGGKGTGWLGNWFVLRFHDDPVYAKLGELALQDLQNPQRQANTAEWLRLVCQMPVVVGCEINNPITFAATLTAVKQTLVGVVPDMFTWEPIEPYKGVTMVRIQLTRQAMRDWFRNGEVEPFQPAVYYAQFGGAFYASLRQEPLKGLIDRYAAERDGKKPDANLVKKAEAVDVNASLFVSREALGVTAAFLKKYAALQSHRAAQANLADVYLLHRCGLVPKEPTAEQFRSAALRHLGYMPTDPDAPAYRYDPSADEVSSPRHGSARKPTVPDAPDKDSPLGRALEQLRKARADARFREDGLHSTVIIDQK